MGLQVRLQMMERRMASWPSLILIPPFSRLVSLRLTHIYTPLELGMYTCTCLTSCTSSTILVCIRTCTCTCTCIHYTCVYTKYASVVGREIMEGKREGRREGEGGRGGKGRGGWNKH